MSMTQPNEATIPGGQAAYAGDEATVRSHVEEAMRLAGVMPSKHEATLPHGSISADYKKGIDGNGRWWAYLNVSGGTFIDGSVAGIDAFRQAVDNAIAILEADLEQLIAMREVLGMNR